jgi:hypothetical protein
MTPRWLDSFAGVSLMVDAFCEFADDIQLDPSGGIQSAIGWDEARQEIERDIFTNPQGIGPNGQYLQPDYTWDPTFGTGLPRFVGRLGAPTTIKTLQSKLLTAVLSNPVVLQQPAPIVQFALNQHNLNIFISVFLANQQTGEIALEYSPS